ncbi:hypothetical protein M430DRAFT_41941 [Amorphotheca resinae ATCC 22711]|uniref:Hydrophobin n=1 Tax=Amorphotheca resinae ATCC 22711 TaxID=857342 RepID=A0A2T3B4T9_AMORE|nr:hypothetical protein M430DRAFT_41941 [Amorphotheca resinae ATCC 22711]PSS20652.1 hypothetical protein M430DRAFT_41941 [Amorphotheca resinae ATCC 22711]
MIAQTIIAAFTFALAAVAHPTSEPTVGPNGNAFCGNGQVISCCNKTDNNSNNGKSGLLGLGLDGVLGGSCQPLNIPVLAVDVPLTQACAGNQAACCTGDENGLVNLQCTNVNV